MMDVATGEAHKEQECWAQGGARGGGGKVVVIGGGIQGLACGWSLARAGFHVTLFEAKTCGAEASGAAAGMLSGRADSKAHDDGVLRGLCLLGQRLWRDFARHVQEASGIDIDYRQEGTIHLAYDKDEHHALARHMASHMDETCDEDARPYWLSREQLTQREPHLTGNIFSALYYPDEHSVDSRLVIKALCKALRASGGVIHEKAHVSAVLTDNGRVSGVMSAGTAWACDYVIVAAGAWSMDVEGIRGGHGRRAQGAGLGVVRPIKGQMIALRMEDSASIRHHVWMYTKAQEWGEGCYLVPRQDGRLLVGATIEDRGMDREMYAGAVSYLLRAACRMVPAVEHMAIESLWTGLRPQSSSSLPWMGRLEGSPRGVFYACGHYRHGILLAPVTASTLLCAIRAERQTHDASSVSSRAELL
ncbi:MAG: glycine oxidase ThiO [Alphaproteobacteria bacterium GM7ARS4]|nr:glycine oxidase ThiO [Alphaproteobacteria bacterium GM7ARS4]